MNVNERIRLLRQTLCLTQQRFAEPLHMTQNSISSIEKGIRSVNDRFLDNVVHNYGVNPEWLKAGQEPMFLDFTPGIDADIRQLGMQYLKLSDQQRKVVRDMVDAFLSQETAPEDNASGGETV